MILLASASNAVSGEFVKLKLVRNVVVEAYVHFDAEAFDAKKILLALPPGTQSRGSVNLGLAPWIDELEATGWTIISPVAPSGRRFMGRNLGLVPHVLSAVKREYKIQFDKVSLFGISNGGIGALESAVHFTELFRSVTVAPGMLIVKDGIASLGSLPLTLIVGENDALWLSEAKQLDQLLSAREQPARHEIVVIPGADHMAFEGLASEFLVERLLRE